ncbi:NACHT domain-containing protein [Tychonema sp. BBK16]|uniref:NACHT domain-containing protein n=1 Tax=Tychonema sp. BBK16 TaxID=2699888 RepID=UPI0038D2B201
MNDRANEVNSTFWGYVQNSTVVTAGGNVQLTLTNGAVLSVQQEDWVDFSDLIARVTQRLVGRGFVFERVADFIQNTPCGYFHLIADAGLGKTAIAAELTKRYQAPACFISANENRTQPERILNILSTQLIARYALPHTFLPVGAGKTSDWFYERLKEAALKEAAINPKSLPVVVVIDAIDEADVPPPGCNWLYLPKNLPKGVYVILTHRDGNYLLTTDPGVRVKEQIITWDDPLQQTDIESHLRRQVKRPEMREVLENATPTVTQEQFIAKFQEASQGNFMYLEYVLDSIIGGEAGFTPLDLNKLPQGLRSYYDQFWAGMEAVRCKEGWDEWSHLYCPVIELLGVALEPVSLEWFADHVGRKPDEIRVRALQVWRRFLNKEQQNNRENWRIIHQSFANFLQERFEIQAAHRSLVEYYFILEEKECQKRHNGYALRHLRSHLNEANLEQEKKNQILDKHKWLLADPKRLFLLQVVENEVVARLKQSLHDPVNIFWNFDIKIGDNPSEDFSVNKSILEVLDRDQIAGKLLILGSPGLGKTTIMLTLAKALIERAIERAKQDDNYLIPILFNLSTWKDNKQSISDWLVMELKSKYGVRKDFGAKLVSDAKLLPMLDGLDELELVYQEPCVRRINEFLHSDCSPRYLVVSSRREEYEQVVRGQSGLDVNGKIILQPLTPEQVQAYLVGINPETLPIDANLLELLKTPLFLSLIRFILFHQSSFLQKWITLSSSQDRLQYLFDVYWEAALKRPLVSPILESQGWISFIYKKKKTPQPQQVRQWLVFLAQQLQRESQSEFAIENIQPNWLSNRCNKQIYALGVGLFFGLISGLIIGTIIFVIILNFLNIFIGLIVGLCIGIFVAIFSTIWAFVTIGQSPDIEPVETLEKSWLNLAKSLGIGILIGVISWLIIEAISPTLGWKHFSIEFFLIIGPALVSILEWKPAQLIIRNKPNAGILSSLNNAMRFAIAGAIWMGLSAFIMRQKIFYFIVSLLFNQSAITSSLTFSMADTVTIVFSGMLAGLFFGLTQAGIACIQHFTLRLILYRNGYIPWNYASFLDYCTERGLLQRVGGRYRFIHRLVQEHFEAMPLRR